MKVELERLKRRSKHGGDAFIYIYMNTLLWLPFVYLFFFFMLRVPLPPSLPLLQFLGRKSLSLALYICTDTDINIFIRIFISLFFKVLVIFISCRWSLGGMAMQERRR